MDYPKSIQKLIDSFSKFPTVGPRTATRFVFYLMKVSKEEIEELIKAITNLKKEVKICSFCFNPFDPSFAKASGGSDVCKICADKTRDKTLLCIVERETDLNSIEKTKKYKGLYFILGGTISNLRKEEIKKFPIKKLIARIRKPKNFVMPDVKIKEIIIATNPTTEGESTTLYLERKLKPLGIKITRLGRGLPVGAELEYTDKETLGSALEGRK